MSRICVSLSRAGDVSAAPTRRRALRGAAPLAANSVSLCSRAATPHPGSGSRDPTVLGSCATHPRDHDAPSESSPPGPRVPTRTPSRSYCYERVLLTFVLMMHRAEPLSRGSKLHLSRLPSSATSFDPAGSAEGRRTPREPSPPRSILPTAFDPLGACPTQQERSRSRGRTSPQRAHRRTSRTPPAPPPPPFPLSASTPRLSTGRTSFCPTPRFAARGRAVTDAAPRGHRAPPPAPRSFHGYGKGKGGPKTQIPIII